MVHSYNHSQFTHFLSAGESGFGAALFGSQWNVLMEVSPLQRTDSRRLQRQCPVVVCVSCGPQCKRLLVPRARLTVMAQSSLILGLFFPRLVRVVPGVEEPAEPHLENIELATWKGGEGQTTTNAPGNVVRDTR